ncbi:MAG: beta-lactamase family protein, partial [Deltaproteobacteria bacterium]|nr:beta-lactamase family protein [Deltaproteobacteria bacterium]
IDPVALAELVREAEASGSTALVVLHDGRRIGEWYFGGCSEPTEMMSATKSIVALAIELLIEDGRLESLDEPVWKLFPEWNQGQKQKITVRHLLSQTSGLQAQRDTREVYQSPDFVRLALADELSDPPGTRFFYNNKAVNLLAGVAERACGKKLDDYLAERLFAPLGIRDFGWSHDGAGNPHAMSGLRLHAVDAAKIGQFLLDEGVWQGRRLLAAERVRELTSAPSQRFVPDHGLLFWRIYEHTEMDLPQDLMDSLVKAGFPAELAQKLAGFTRPGMGASAFYSELKKRLNESERAQFWEAAVASGVVVKDVPGGRVVGFAARGYLGQYLVVLPSQRIVAVRFSNSAGASAGDIDFDGFEDRVRALVPPSPGRARSGS